MSVTAPQGFHAAACTAGIKPSGNPDMALVVNNGPRYDAAALFTKNKVTAAPVKLSRTAASNGRLTAMLINAGNANACNGQQGEADAAEMQSRMASLLEMDPQDVAIASTGLIGDLLPMDAVRQGIDALPGDLRSDAVGGTAAATAIMTTDTVTKETVINAEGFTVGGMGKGVGMMAPSLATMLVCLTTDASASPEALHTALSKACATTFDRLDIDGTTSTNDTVIVLASGASGTEPDQDALNAALHTACADLARQMQADAEGVTKRVSITVTGASDDAEALNAARTIGRDNLTKCALFGSDPNWGRVLAAVGMAQADMEPEHITVKFNGETVCHNSTGVPGAREVDLSGTDIAVEVDLGTGEAGQATIFTTDLSFSYVDINSAYSS